MYAAEIAKLRKHNDNLAKEMSKRNDRECDGLSVGNTGVRIAFQGSDLPNETVSERRLRRIEGFLQIISNVLQEGRTVNNVVNNSVNNAGKRRRP